MAEHEPDDASVLLVDTGDAAGSSLADALTGRTGWDVTVASDLDAAQRRLASTAVDCLVVNLDPLDDDHEFVADARSLAPDCPIVAFTARGGRLSPERRTDVTTLVEGADDFDNEAFLVEKVRRSLHPPTPERDDDDLYRLLVESARDGLYQLNARGEIVYANEASAEMLGYGRDELLGSHVSRLMADGELARGQHVIQQLLDDRTRESDVVEHEVVTNDGDRITLAINFVLLTTDDGAYDGALCIARDVTERKRYEERLEELTEQLEALNRVVRHDIRNDMAVMLGWTELLEDHVDDAGREYVRNILDRGNRIVELTDVTRDSIDALTSERDFIATATALRPVLETELALRRESFPDAEFVVSDDVPAVDVSADELLSSVFRNLLNNAVQHNDRETPVVTVSVDGGDETVEIRIADNGPGIPDDRKEAVFGKGEGGLESSESGIGLYLVRTLVDRYDGDVWIEDNEPTGSVFCLRLRRAN
jgi:PAS domain S-box-containing protein